MTCGLMRLFFVCRSIHSPFWMLLKQNEWREKLHYKTWRGKGLYNKCSLYKAVRKGTVMGVQIFQYPKWRVYNGNLLDREASRELTMLYQRRKEEERRRGEFVPYRTYFRSSMFNIIKWRRHENTYCKEKA